MPARPPSTAGTQNEQADLERLAAELAGHGCKTVLVTGEDRRPHLDVIHPDAPTLGGRVYVQAGSFWWPWCESIASRDDPAAAAQAVARALHAPEAGR